MNRRFAPAYAVALALLDAAAIWGQEPGQSGNLPTKTQCVRFEIMQGRLTATCSAQSFSRSASAAHPSGSPSESLSISAEGGKPTVRYEWKDARQEVLIEFFAGTDVRISREPRGDALQPRVKFEQLTGKDLKLTVEIGDSRRAIGAPTIWHLLLCEPAMCREHLLPLLELLRTDWLLAERVERLSGALVDMCQAGIIDQRERCAALVDKLGSDSYQARQEADRELRTLDQAFAANFRRLDLTRLDPEQRQRLRKIADDLAVRSADTPERAAVWLLDDQTVWLTLLSHEQAAYRHVAALQLSRICDRPIEFDPAAAEIERKAQIERLRERLAKGL